MRSPRRYDYESQKRAKKRWDERNPNYNKEYRLKNRDEINQKKREWKLKNKEKIKLERIKYLERLKNEHPEKFKAMQEKHRLRESMRKFGLPRDEFEKLKTVQNNLCATCGQPPNKKSLAIDHHHVTGKVRGLLCFKCNTVLGLVKENIETLNKMVIYLLKNY